MSDFLSNFKSFFSVEERESEIYKILAAVGVNAEKVILEELDAEIRRSTEASVFTTQKLRSWLAFFLTPVRNSVSASGVGRIIISDIKNSNDITVSIPKGSSILGKNGKTYEIQEDVTLTGVGSSSPFTFIQGVSSSVTTKYSEFIAIPIEAGGLDMSSVKVFLSASNIEIPLVSSFKAYPKNLEEEFNKLSSFSRSYIEGDYSTNDISLWNPLLNNVRSLWAAVSEVSSRPDSGFFPFFYNNVLFIKIFPGGVPGSSNFIPEPDDQDVTVEYRISDGALGNIGKDQLDSFVNPPSTSDGGIVDYSLSNSATIDGVNPPTHAELVNLLRKRFFASTHVSSVPEYTSWFLAQSGIGDCLVVSDYERWRLSGASEFSGFDITGTVDIYLLDINGAVISTKDTDGELLTEIQRLDDQLSDVRDIAFVDYKTPEVYHHYFVVQFRSVSSESSFIEAARSSISELYSIKWVRENNLSLFKDLDMDKVTAMLKGGYNPSGLRIFPYHYYEYVFSDVNSPSKRFSHFYGERPGGWYEYWEFDDPVNPTKLGYFERDSSGNIIPDGNFIEGLPCAVYKEWVGLANDCSIYRYNRRPRYIGNELSGWDWSSIWVSQQDAYVGYRSAGDIIFGFSGLAPGVLRCFWAIENEGMIPVGSSPAEGFGVRKLPNRVSSIGSKTSSETYFKEVSHFEKYS